MSTENAVPATPVAQMTITAALADIKTIGKRLEKKRTFIREHIFRQGNVLDPLEGGSTQAVNRARNAITSLENRIVSLRSLIAESNQTQDLMVCGVRRPVANWLVWRREIATPQGAFLNRLQNDITSARHQVAEKHMTMVTGNDARDVNTVVMHVDELALADEIEQHEQILGDLDGALSAFNATTYIYP